MRVNARIIMQGWNYIVEYYNVGMEKYNVEGQNYIVEYFMQKQYYNVEGHYIVKSQGKGMLKGNYNLDR